jgi:CRISPR type I-D-associated protein Csc1
MASNSVADINNVYLCRLVTHDYFFLTRQGFTQTFTSEYIGNYGLMYALNRTVSSIQRCIINDTKPFYDEDLAKFNIYVTPAKPLLEDKFPWIDGQFINWQSQPKIMLTYNSINTFSNTTAYAKDDPRAKLNFPLVGKKEKTPPLTSYIFYAIGKRPESLIRLGKKMSPVRIIIEQLIVKKYANEFFKPSHPVNISDTSSKIVEGVLYHQFPPLFLDAKLKGEYYLCQDQHGHTHSIALPKPDIYCGVEFKNLDNRDQN